MASKRQSTRTSIGIVGTGIAGMGCAHFLHKTHDIAIYEQNNYVGGHTNTVTVDEDGTEIPIDTGFMVYNEVTYPNLVRLFNELNVETKYFHVIQRSACPIGPGIFRIQFEPFVRPA